MASMNISLPDPMRDWIQHRIDGGQYASVSDYVRDLIRKDQDRMQEISVEEIRASIAEGRKHGGTTPADAVFGKIEARLKAVVG